MSGKDGVTILSGGDTTVSASTIKAGDATHSADLNIQTGGNLIVSSAKDTETEQDSAKRKGFLRSGSSSYDAYNETTVGSKLSATGDVNLDAGKAAVIVGSKVNADGSLNVSGESVSIIGAQENHQSDSQRKDSGLFVGSGGGFISLYGKNEKQGTLSSTDNVESSITADNGNINLNATKGDLSVIGSSIAATKGDVAGTAAGNINILPGHESSDSSKDDKRSGFGLQVSAGSNGASIGIGAGRFTDKTTESADTNAVSKIGAGGNITLAAGDTFNDQAGQIAAGGAVTILGTNGVNILSGNDVTNFDEVATNLFAGVSLGVSSSMVGAGQSIDNLASKLGNVTDGYSAANVGFAGMKAYDALSSLKEGLAAGNIASVSLTAGFTYSKTETELLSSTPVLPTISGNSVSIISTNGDFTSRGLQVSATADGSHAADPMNGSVLISANTIDMAGAQATNTASSSSQSAGASIGVSVGVGLGGATGITPTASVSAGQSKSGSASTTQVMSTVSATNNITFASKGDTTLNNTIFSADTIDGKVGGNLDIVSTPNTGSQSNSSSSLGLSFTGPTVGNTAGQPLLTSGNVDTALGGLTLGGVQPGFGSGKGAINWIDTPAGLYSTGDQHITVSGNTNLAASGLISTGGEVNLDTGTLTWSDFVGTQKYQGYQVSADIDTYSGVDANGKTQNNSSASGKYQLDDVEQSVKATISSGGAAGNVIVRNPDQQASLEQSGQTRPVNEINTAPAKQNVVTKDKHIDLEPYASVQSLQAAVIAGQTVAQAIGDAISRMTAAGVLTPEDSKAAVALAAYANDPKVLAQLASCGANHSENEYHFFDRLITPAHADPVSCSITTASGTYWVTPDGAWNCYTLFRNSTSAILGDTAAATAALASIMVLLTPGTAGQEINTSRTLDDGTVVQITGQASEVKRVATITTSDNATISVVLNCYSTSCNLVSGTYNGTAMLPGLLSTVADQLSRDGKMQVVYNEKSGSGTAGGNTPEGKPNLLDPDAEAHVLDGDAEGGGHRPGTGNPGKSEFPSGWSDEKILGEISDVPTDPASDRSPGRDGATVVIGERDGVKIRVIVSGDGKIISGWPVKGTAVVQNQK